ARSRSSWARRRRDRRSAWLRRRSRSRGDTTNGLFDGKGPSLNDYPVRQLVALPRGWPCIRSTISCGARSAIATPRWNGPSQFPRGIMNLRNGLFALLLTAGISSVSLVADAKEFKDASAHIAIDVPDNWITATEGGYLVAGPTDNSFRIR